MNILLSLLTLVLAATSIYQFMRRLHEQAQPKPINAHAATPYASRVMPNAYADSATKKPLSPCRTVRVIEVRDSRQTIQHGGRMVISGRMADVCAELDRLAAREAAAG